MLKITFSVLLVLFISTGFQNNAQQIEIGKPVPDLTLTNIHGEEISVSDLRGKVILIDFWASWCKPCRKLSSRLVKSYNKYNSAQFKNGEEGFVIYSVSLDRDEEAWKKAIEKDEMNWDTHFLEKDGWQSKSVRRFGVNAIPFSVLVNGDGIVMEKNVGEQLHFILKDYLK